MVRVVISTVGVTLALLAAGPAVSRDLLKQVDGEGRVIYADKAIDGGRVLGLVESPDARGGRADAVVAQAPTASAPRRAAEAAPAGPRRAEVRWAGETAPVATINAAYVELEAARAASEEAESRLKAAVVPQQGETVQRADGTLRYLPAYFERVAPFERDAMIAQERLERADRSLRVAR